MKKRFLLFGAAIMMAIGSVIAQSSLIGDAVTPTCDYQHCPGGLSNCCTQGGVTLYNNHFN